MHVVFKTQAVDASASWSHDPPAHGVGATAPPGQKVPTLHSSHTTGDVVVAAAVSVSPAGHAPAGLQEAWFGPDV
jgi:hypothetical protein